MIPMLFRDPQAPSSVHTVWDTTAWTFGSPNHVKTLDSVSSKHYTCSYSLLIKGDSLGNLYAHKI